MDPATLDDVVALLKKFQFHYSNEIELQEGIAKVLTDAKIAFDREKSLGKAGRIDFLVGTIGIEVKIKGSPSAVGRQVINYLEKEELSCLILVTGRILSASFLRKKELLGKRVEIVTLWQTAI
jgi:transaldolase